MTRRPDLLDPAADPVPEGPAEEGDGAAPGGGPPDGGTPDGGTPDGVRDVDLRRAAMDHLARREFSRRDLVRRLGRRFRDVEAARLEAVVEALADEGLQSDVRCAESLIRIRAEKGHGPLRIRSDLREAGLEGEAVDLLLEAEEDAWPDRLAAVAERRFGADAPADRRDWARRARFLASRGFPEPLVVRVLGDPPPV
jgi:regulatory protein